MPKQGEFDVFPKPSGRRSKLRRYEGSRWIRFQKPYTLRLPDYPCCYVVYGGTGKLLYVGQTLNLRSRFYAHRQTGAFPQDLTIKARFGETYGDWAMRESRLIYRLRPPLNVRSA